MAREYKYTSDFAELRDVSYHPQPKPADLAADVLDAVTRKLRDYDRLAAALTSAQEDATKNLERARAAEARLADLEAALVRCGYIVRPA